MHPISLLKATVLSVFILLFVSFSAFSQAPNLLNYQGVARNSVGNPLPNQTMKLRLSIHDLLPSGAVVYSEIRQITTNLGGLFSVQIGSAGASSSTGTLGGVNWLVGNKFLQVELDPTSNSNYLDIGTVQLVSVPYAFGAGSAATVKTNANLTGVVTSLGNATSIANGAITSDMIGTLNKSKVGLDLVNNTSDAAKPISTLAQAALENKLNIADSTSAYVTPTQLAANKFDLTPITNAIAGKLAIADSTNSYVTPAKLAAKAFDSTSISNRINLKVNTSSLATVATSGSYNDLTNKPTVPAAYSLPTASVSELGGIKVGTGLSIDGDGVLTAGSGVPYSGATGAVDLGAFDLKVNGLTVGRGGGNVDGNTANGNMSLYSNSSGNSNTAYGYASLYSNTTGMDNIANGNQSLYFNTTGSNNTAIGNASLNKNITGQDNTAIGIGSLYNNNGSYNTANGTRSLYSNTTGGSNTALGYYAGTTNTTGNQNTLIGYYADVSSNNLSNATAIGYEATVSASNTIQLGNTSVTNVKTSGTLTTGTVTYPNTHGTSGQVLSTTGSGTLTWTTASGGGSQWTSSSNDIYYSTGNVGIGTNSPSSKLHLVGAEASGERNNMLRIESNNNASLTLKNTNANAGGGEYQLFTSSSNSNPSLGAGSLAIYYDHPSAAAYRFSINTAGNVGIGTGMPTEKLDVLGNVKTSGTLTAGTVTYPSSHGTSGQVLSTTGSGTLTWTGLSANFTDLTTDQNIGGAKQFDKAATNTSAFNAGTSSTIDFGQSNLAYTSAGGAAPTYTLTNMKDGGAYTLVLTRTTNSGSATFINAGFTNKYMGTDAMTSGKTHIYSFIAIGTVIYVTMATEN